jgi:hypothetical protein
MRRILLVTAIVLLAVGAARAQGITTSAINGQVTDSKGEHIAWNAIWGCDSEGVVAIR